MRKVFIPFFILSLGSLTSAFAEQKQNLMDALYGELQQAIPSQIDKEIFAVSNILDKNMRLYSNQDNPIIQNIVDEVFDQVFRTKFGSQICLQTGSVSRGIISQLGVSEKKALELSAHCESIYPDLTKKDHSGQNFKYNNKKYYFVFDVPASLPFQSWTSLTNETYIVFDYKYSIEELYARIIHEYFMTNDSKMLLGSAAAFDLEGWHGSKILNAGRGKERETNIRQIFGIVPFPLLKFSFASLRAMLGEYLILKEIFPNFLKEEKVSNIEVFKLLEKDKISEALKLTMESLADHQDYLLPIEYMIFPKPNRKDLAAHLYISKSKIPTAIQIFQDSKLVIEEPSGKKYSVLNWLVWPSLGPQSSFFSRGPRPRIGGGWTERSADSQQPDDVRIDILNQTGAISNKDSDL